uniref:Uncharacterized protein n=1 Tax=Calidris pygmaea TaxID=425635 RepID=A0A8C3JWT8_9CHAR
MNRFGRQPTPAAVFCLFSSQITFCYRFLHLDDRSGCCLWGSPSCNCTLISNCLEEIQSIQATRRRPQIQHLARKKNTGKERDLREINLQYMQIPFALNSRFSVNFCRS